MHLSRVGTLLPLAQQPGGVGRCLARGLLLRLARVRIIGPGLSLTRARVKVRVRVRVGVRNGAWWRDARRGG